MPLDFNRVENNTSNLVHFEHLKYTENICWRIVQRPPMTSK